MITRSEIKRFASLAAKKHRDELGLFLVEGARAVGEASTSGAGLACALLTHRFSGSNEGGRLLAALRKKGVRVELVAEQELDAVTDTVHAQGVAAIVRQESTSTEDLLTAARKRSSLLVALDGVADPGNLGSMVRTCDWFGADGVLLGRQSVDLYNPKVVRATMGSLFHLRIAAGVDLAGALDQARREGFTVAVADASGARRVGSGPLPGKLVVVFGNEAHGVSEALKQRADLGLAIPRYGAAESLNVGVACGVILASVRLGLPGHAAEAGGRGGDHGD